MSFLSTFLRVIFLFPLSIVYGLIVWIRNQLFDIKVLSSKEFSLPVICVGNITVGGTGKTIHVEYLIRILKEQYKVAMLSRGYLRITNGFVLANSSMDYKKIGDEPRQIKQKFPDITVAVDASRVRGIENIIKHDENCDVVILDDAYQHRKVTPGFNILLIDYNQPLDSDYMLPYGRLREHPNERKRADIIIVTKVPENIKPIEIRILEKQVKMFAFHKIYFTMLKYSEAIPVFFNPNRKKTDPLKGNPSILLITGVVNAKPLKEYLDKFSNTIKHIEYSDHYAYDALDIKQLIADFESIACENKIIITTEKDAMRFQIFTEMDEKIKSQMFYIPVSIEFIDNQAENFKTQILHFINVNKSNNILNKKAKHTKTEYNNSGLRTGWIDKRYRS